MDARWLWLVPLILAGCTDDPAGPADAPAPVVVEDPEDFTYIGDASFDNGGHIHNYWGGQDSIVVVDEMQQGQVGMFGLPNVTVHVFRPDDRVVIPQGTGRVDVTLSWVNDAFDRHGDVELWIKTAADNVPRPVAIMENGATVSFVSTHVDNDLPHQVLSAWELHIVAYLPDDQIGGRWGAQTTVHAEAFRLLDLPVFPAHPDQWDGANEVVLLDEPGSTLFQSQDPVIQGCFGGDCMYAPYDFADGAIVPRDAAAVVVRVTWSGHPASVLGLMYHGADSRAWDTPPPGIDEAGHRVWEIPVTGVMGDGPYSIQSLWEMNVFIEDPSMVFTGDYHISATAVRSP